MKRWFLGLVCLLAPALAHGQGIPYQLNPPAPNARVLFCPVPDAGYPCPSPVTVYSDSATTLQVAQPISVGSSGNLSVYFAAGTASWTVQLLGTGYGPQNRYVVSGGASSSGAAPSSAYTFYPVSGTSCAAQSYSPSGTFYCAFPGLPNGNPTYSGTDFAVVFNSVTALLATQGGGLKWRTGVYNINSMTLDATTACSNLGGSGAALAYAMLFPSNAQAASVQWLLEGETTSVWLGESVPVTINTSGVIFNITPTAVSSVAAGSVLNGFWQRPTTTCALQSGFGGTPNTTNDVHYKNITVRFPVNTRGNEIHFNNWFNNNVEHENDVADFNVTYNTIATGAAPTKGTYGSFGFTSTVSNSGNWEFFKNTFATGMDTGYDFLSEHVFSEVGTAIYCNFPAIFGRGQTNPQSHSGLLIHFNDQENGAGIQFGSGMGQGTRVDLYDLVMEVGNDANWYSTARNKQPALSETNAGFTSGTITFTYVLQNSTSNPLPTTNLFTSGGSRFQSTPNGQSPNFALANVADNFTRPNGGIGPDWGSPTLVGTGCNEQISSNAVVGNASATICVYAAQASNNDQFSRATVATVDGSGLAVIVRASLAAFTYYDFTCNSATGRLLRKRVAGSFTTLASTATNCSAGQVMELQVIGQNLIGFINGQPDLSATDASIASGGAGFVAGAAGDSFTNWSGGSLPVADYASAAPRSLFSPTSFRSIPVKAHVTTADYTNATTTFSNVTGVGQVAIGLGFQIAANTNYTLSCSILWSSSVATAGPQFQFTGPASPTSVQYSVMQAVTATTDGTAGATAFSTALNASGATVIAATNEPALITLGLVNGANAGTIQLQAAAQGAGTLTIRQGSSCTLQ